MTPTRTLLLEVRRDGMVEVEVEPTKEQMADLGWCRITDATQWAQECAAAGKALLQPFEPMAYGRPAPSEAEFEASSGALKEAFGTPEALEHFGATNGHPIAPAELQPEPIEIARSSRGFVAGMAGGERVVTLDGGAMDTRWNGTEPSDTEPPPRLSVREFVRERTERYQKENPLWSKSHAATEAIVDWLELEP